MARECPGAGWFLAAGLPRRGTAGPSGVRTSVSAWMCPWSHALLWITAVVGLAPDLVTKHMAFVVLPSSRQIVLIPGVLSLERLIQGISGSTVVSLDTDIRTRTGERIVVFTLAAPLRLPS
jgi:hypothetical protein